MNRNEWVEKFAELLGTEPPGTAEIEALLELAGTAAHASERTAAPVACWMAGQTGRPIAELIPIAGQVGPE